MRKCLKRSWCRIKHSWFSFHKICSNVEMQGSRTSFSLLNGILYVLGVLRCLPCSRALRSRVIGALYVLAGLACLHALWTWRVCMLGVLCKKCAWRAWRAWRASWNSVFVEVHKMACLVCFISWRAWRAYKNCVLGKLYKMTCWNAWRA